MNKVEATKLKEAFDQDGVVVIRNLITQQQLDEICEKAEMSVSYTHLTLPTSQLV